VITATSRPAPEAALRFLVKRQKNGRHRSNFTLLQCRPLKARLMTADRVYPRSPARLVAGAGADELEVGVEVFRIQIGVQTRAVVPFALVRHR
jgi:hypothetical protein